MRRILGAALLVVGAAAAAFVVGMRRKSPVLQDRIRQLSKQVGQPLALRTAGRPGQANGVIHHVGRRSGTEYATPMTPFRIGDELLIALPYTAKADWVRNVLAAGTARVDHDGESLTVTDPEVVSYAQVAGQLPTPSKVVAKVFDLQEFLRLRIVR